MLRLIAYFLTVIVLLNSTIVMAEFYKWVDESGQTHFSDQKPLNDQAQNIELDEIVTYTSASVVDADLKSESEASDSRSIKKKNRKVIIYSAAWCGICTKAKKYFKKKKIPYKEYDIDTSKKGRRDFKKLKARGVPVILVGKKRLNGFDIDKFEAMYRL